MREQGTKIEVNSKDDWKKYSKFRTGKYERKSLLTIEEIKFLINTKYCDCGKHTKEYIYQELLKDDKKDIPQTIIVKEDFIEEVKSKRPDLDKLDIDYSSLPDIIYNKNKLYKVWSRAIIGGVEIGLIRVGYRTTIMNGSHHFYDRYLKHIGEEVDPKIESYYLDKIKKMQGDDYDYTYSHITKRKHGIVRLTCKKCGAIIWVDVEIAASKKIKCYECKEQEEILQRIEDAKNRFLEKLKEQRPDIDPNTIEYQDSNNVIFTCSICGNKHTTISRDLIERNLNCTCPKCSAKRVGEKSKSNLEEFKKKLDGIYGPETFDYSKAVYKGSMKPITLIDTETGLEFTTIPNKILMGRGYSVRHKNSLGERLVQKCLVELGIKFESEVRKDGVFEGHYVRIDFILPDLNVWIEYNGKQHYQCCPEFLRLSEDLAEEKFKIQQERDEAIRVYCREQGITLIEIPYTLSTYEQIKKYINDSIQTKNIQ